MLVLAVEAATTNPQGALPPEPDGALPAGLRFTWCHYEAKQIAKDLMAWTKAHKGGKTSPTPGGEQEAKASASPTPPDPVAADDASDEEWMTRAGGAGSGTNPSPPVSQTEERTKIEREQLMPMEAFDAMAGALRHLVNGLAAFEESSEIKDAYIDRSDVEARKFTDQGEIQLDDLVEASVTGIKRLAHFDYHLLKYLPNWCESQLRDTRTVVERAAWMLWGACVAAGDHWDVPHGKPGLGPDAASHVYWMVKPAYQELCGKLDEYRAAEGVASDQWAKDRGYIKQPNGEWHPTPEMLKEMEVSS